MTCDDLSDDRPGEWREKRAPARARGFVLGRLSVWLAFGAALDDGDFVLHNKDKATASMQIAIMLLHVNVIHRLSIGSKILIRYQTPNSTMTSEREDLLNTLKLLIGREENGGYSLRRAGYSPCCPFQASMTCQR